MSFKAEKINTLTVQLDQRAGALADVLSAFRESAVNVKASWGYEMGPGKAELVLWPENIEKAKSVLTQLTKKATVGQACYVWGKDEPGVYAEVLSKVSKAGINLTATDALTLNGYFATVLFTADIDVIKLCKTLGC